MKTFAGIAAEMPLPEGFHWNKASTAPTDRHAIGIMEGEWWHFGIIDHAPLEGIMFAHRPDGEQITMREGLTDSTEQDMRLMYSWFLMGVYEP